MDECFPKTHPLHKIINRNKVKLSYSCMPNIGSLVKRHNSKILSPQEICEKCDCNDVCPVNGECKKKNIIYQATIQTPQGERHTYTGLSMNTFKERLIQHKSDLRGFHPKPKTTLSKKVWELKRQNNVFSMTWKIVDRANKYTPASNSCNLCISEIFHILFKTQNAT